MAVTLKDIADQSGVSMKTVSRVLNNEPNVSPATRERVEDAATELGYRPNLAARGLATSRSFLIALLYDDVSSSYVLSLMQGATDACHAAGYHLVVEPVVNRELDTPAAVARLLRRLNVDGLILTPPLSDNPALLDSLDALGMRAVRLAPIDRGGAHPVITIANAAAAREVMAHVLALGHRRIGFITGPDGHSASRERLRGYREALEAAGIAFDPALVVEGDFTWRSGRAAAKALMQLASGPTAVFACNDDMAAGVLSWMGAHGRKAPQDIAVAGFDDTPLSRIVHPPLTTVGQDVRAMGALAADILMDDDPKTSGARSRPHEYSFAHTLVVRASTDPG